VFLLVTVVLPVTVQMVTAVAPTHAIVQPNFFSTLQEGSYH